MPTSRTTVRRAFLMTPLALALGLRFVPVGLARADDDKDKDKGNDKEKGKGKTQSVDAGGLTFRAPAGWKASTPKSAMRRAELEVPAVKGDEEPARLIVFAFPGGAGTVDANVERWQRMFRDKDGDPPKVQVKVVKGKNTDATRVEMAGHYIPPAFPGQKKEPERDDFRLLAGIVIAPEASYFLRLVGPERTVTDARPAFDDLLSSVELAGKK